MFDNNSRQIPGWLGPLLGASISVYFVLRGAVRDGTPIPSGLLVMSAVLGGGAGCILWLVDRRGKPDQPEATERGNSFSRAIAVVQILAFWIPVAGTFVCAAGLALNWRVVGWPKILCWVGLVLSLPLTILMVAMPFLAP